MSHPKAKNLPVKPAHSRPRMVPREGNTWRVVRVGHKKMWFNDLYVELMAMSWPLLSVLIAMLYVASNTAFALIYYFNSNGVENMHPGSFQDAFFFSVQTMATIGYGKMVPISTIANTAVTFEALFGFSFFAVATALVFAKFSQPSARVLFSNVAVISPYNGKPHLKLRLANRRTNRIVDATVKLVLLVNETTQEGFQMRRFYDLPLARDNVPLMQLTWTVMHPLDESSPLYGATPEKLEAMEAEIIVALTGLDETMSQTIHARHSYIADEIICDAFFEDILTRRPDGYVEVNYRLFDSVRVVQDKAA